MRMTIAPVPAAAGPQPARLVRTLSPGRRIAALAALLGLAVVAWSSLATTPLLIAPRSSATTGPGLVPVPAPTVVATQPAPPPDVAEPGASEAAWRVVVALVGAAAAAVTILVLVLVVRALLRRLAATGAAPAPLLDDGDLDLSVLTTERAAHQARLLAEGSPRNAVVATWLELERTVADAGVTRRPTETSTELGVRVLSIASAPADALTDLGVLFREARFSTHELTEEHRRPDRRPLRSAPKPAQQTG